MDKTNVYIVTATDSDGDTWIVHVCDTPDTAQHARLKFASHLVSEGICEDVDEAIDSRKLRVAYHVVQSVEHIDAEYEDNLTE